MKRKSEMPLYNALKEHREKKLLSFHMPGHIGGNIYPHDFKEMMLDFDLTELPELDNLYNPTGIIDQAQKKASIAFGSDKTFFLVNGATSGILAMIAGTLKAGDKLIVPRNCHRSVAAAMALCDINPVYIKNEYSQEHALMLPISPEQVLNAFECNPDAKGILVVNPDYYGICGDLKEIGKITHRLGKLFLVDEAHGAHLVFHKDLPASAASADADVWVQSAHKTLPSFTQAGFLHMKGNKVDSERILSMLTLFQTSSPSYMLMASLDWARNFMEERGCNCLEEIIGSVRKLVYTLRADRGIKTIGDYGLDKHIFAVDPTRLCLDMRWSNMTGFLAHDRLRKLKVEPEMADFYRLVFICTVAHTSDMFDLLLKKLKLLLEPIIENTPVQCFPSMYSNLPKQIHTPRQAVNSIIESVPLILSEGRICAQSIGAYPPGIPRFCPGELIDREGIEELTTVKSLGGDLFGLRDNLCVNVVK